MYTDSQKIDMVLEKVYSIDVRLSVLETSLKGLPDKVEKLERDSQTSKLVVKIAGGSVPILLILLKWLGITSLIKTIGEMK